MRSSTVSDGQLKSKKKVKAQAERAERRAARAAAAQTPEVDGARTLVAARASETQRSICCVNWSTPWCVAHDVCRTTETTLPIVSSRRDQPMISAESSEESEAFTRRPLSESDLDAIHDQAMRILENIGTEVHSDVMLKMLDEAGQRVDGTRVRWDAGFVMDQLAKAPSQFTLAGT